MPLTSTLFGEAEGIERTCDGRDQLRKSMSACLCRSGSPRRCALDSAAVRALACMRRGGRHFPTRSRRPLARNTGTRGKTEPANLVGEAEPSDAVRHGHETRRRRTHRQRRQLNRGGRVGYPPRLVSAAYNVGASGRCVSEWHVRLRPGGGSDSIPTHLQRSKEETSMPWNTIAVIRPEKPKKAKKAKKRKK